MLPIEFRIHKESELVLMQPIQEPWTQRQDTKPLDQPISNNITKIPSVLLMLSWKFSVFEIPLDKKVSAKCDMFYWNEVLVGYVWNIQPKIAVGVIFF